MILFYLYRIPVIIITENIVLFDFVNRVLIVYKIILFSIGNVFFY